jgi:hypothetical protein
VKLAALEPLAVQQAGVAHTQGFNVVGKYVVPIKSDEDVRDSQGDVWFTRLSPPFVYQVMCADHRNKVLQAQTLH